MQGHLGPRPPPQRTPKQKVGALSGEEFNATRPKKGQQKFPSKIFPKKVSQIFISGVFPKKANKNIHTFQNVPPQKTSAGFASLH